MSLANPVKTLNAEVARKIAAGEVIDRPNAIIRELMDNAIDSGATSITVEITGGGIEKIRIIDNGCGMTKEDLQACARPHATSKISTETDLMNLSTLGFRGEALASIAAVSRLSITSGGWKMRASITEDHVLEPVAEMQGTIVQSEGLFENFPARRQFLKRPATEGVMCKNTFIEKVMARPDIAFRFIQDNQVKIDLPANQSLKDRFIFANSYIESSDLFYTVSAESSRSEDGIKDWKFDVVIGEPAVCRPNKKDIFIYVNGRRIQEYSLVQAIEYGGQGFFPNGTYPAAVAFISVNPKQVDFNIHPAKKEARFSDISDLHHGLSSNIKAFLHQYTATNFLEDRNTDDIQADFFETPDTITEKQDYSETELSKESPSPAPVPAPTATAPSSFSENTVSDSTVGAPLYERHISYKAPQTGESSFSDFRSKYLGGSTYSGNRNTQSASSNKSSQETLYTSHKTANLAELALMSGSSNADTVSALEAKKNQPPRFIGCCLGTFLLAEKNNNLYLIDQHAAHERILFDKLMTTQGKKQPLLIPYKIRTESKSQDNQLEKLQQRMAQIGFEAEKISDGEWEIKSVPERWTGSEYDLRTLLFVKHVEPEEIIRSLAAMTACKAAVKDGYVLDNETAAKLVAEAFTLPDPHCPHGRPIYTVISREKLFELVKRT